MSSVERPSPARCLAVWVGASLAVAGLAVAVASDLAAGWSTAIDRGADARFDVLLVGLAATAVLACAGWAWAATTAVVVAALRGRPRTGRGVPTWARRLVLTACGVALVGAAAPSYAASGGAAGGADLPLFGDDRQSRGAALAGLPLPDRATGPAAPVVRRPTPARLVVSAGDSLWSLARARLGPDADAADTAALAERLYALNRSVIGDDPDLIRPGQRLEAPDR